MAFAYRQVKDLYDTLHDAGAVTSTLPEWSDEMNRLSGTDLYSSGLNDNFIKRTSVALDRLLEATGAPEALAPFGRAVGEAVGAPDTGEAIARSTPRMLVDFGSLAIPGVGWGAGAARLGIAGLMSGANTYTATGSPAAGALAGVTAGVLPPIANVAARAAGPGIRGLIAGQGAAAGVMQASEFGQQALAGEPLQVHPTDMLLNMTLGQLPFAALHLGGKLIRGEQEHSVGVSNRLIELRKMKEKLDVESLPEVDQTTTPEILAETHAVIAKSRGQQVNIKEQVAAGLMTPEDGFVETNKLLQLDTDAMRQREEIEVPGSVFGDVVDSGERTPMVGRPLKETRGSRTVFVEDMEVNPPELRGKVVTYSKGTKEKAPETRSDGTIVFDVASAQWRTPKTIEEWNERFAKVADPLQPELPPQDHPITDQELTVMFSDLKKVGVEAEAAQTPADLQQATVRLRQIEDENGLPPTTDVTLKKIMAEVEKSGLVAPENVAKVALKAKARRVARILKDQQAARPVAKVNAEQATLSGSIATAETIAKLPEELDHAPIRAALDSLMTNARTQRDSKQEFELWKKKNPGAATDLQTETDRFQIYWTLRKRGEIGKEDQLSPDDVAVFHEELRKAELQPDDPNDLVDFPDREHVRGLDDAVTDQLNSILESNAAPKIPDTPEDVAGRLGLRYDGPSLGGKAMQFTDLAGRATLDVPLGSGLNEVAKAFGKKVGPRQVAGDNWLFSIGDYDPATRTLNAKHVLPKSGEVKVDAFRNMAGVGKPLTVAEVELYKVLVPEAFSGESVNVPVLWEGLKTKGPVVEVRKLSDTPMLEETERAQLQHEMETSGLWGENGPKQPRNTQEVEMVRRWQLLSDTISRDDTQGRYSFLGPKPESEMPGYVEGLVRVPQANAKVSIPGESLADAGRRLNEQTKELYHGPHFGSEDRNVLAFYRGYEETLPDGTKAFHVIEVQSDWGQRVRDTAERVKKVKLEERDGAWWLDTDQTTPGRPLEYDSKSAAEAAYGLALRQAERTDAQPHPLLKVYESLALKAAIAHAKEVGATKVILSDGETAMMTEGHDIAATADVTRMEEGGHPLVINQEKGMRLHYDQTLPSAMEKLTGVKGERVDLGEHKNSRNAQTVDQPPESGRQRENFGSPVFRDASGNPKTQITGRLYDISKLPSEFTLTDANRAPQDTVFLPDTPADVAAVNELGHDGHSALKYLSTAPQTFITALSRDLAKFTDSLGRVDMVVKSTASGNAAAYDLGNGRVQITIPAALLGKPGLHVTVAHELVHGLTLVELNNPTNVKFRNDLEAIRQRLGQALPKDQQSRLNELITTGWRDQYSKGQVEFNSILPKGSAAQRQVLYSLLNVKEMVAQGLSSKQTQDFMKSVKGEGTHWYSRFTNLIKNALGLKIDDSVFSEFLSKTDALLDRGNFVSSFSNFAEGYFQNLGMSDNLASTQTRRALGVVLDSGFGTSKSDILTTLSDTANVRSSEITTASRDLNRMFEEKAERFQEHSSVMDELGYAPDQKGLDDFVHEALQGRESSHSDVIDLLPKASQDYIFAKVKDMQDVLGVLKAATNEKNTGLINLADPSVLRGPVREAGKLVDRLLDIRTEWQESERLVNRMSAISPDGFLDFAVRDQFEPELAPAMEAFSRETITKPKRGILGTLGYAVKPVAQIARSSPESAELISRGFELEPAARQYFGQLVKVLGVDLKGNTNELSAESLKASIKTIQTPKTQKAVDRWMAQNNITAKNEKRGVTLLPATHPEVTKILSGLTSDERAGVIDTVSRTSVMTQAGHIAALNHMAKIASTRGALIAVKDSAIKANQGVPLAEMAFKSLMVDPNDVQATQAADAQLKVVQSKMTPEGFLDLLKFTQAEVEKYKLWKKYFGDNPAWATAQRQEKYLVSFTRGGKKYQLQASSTKEANVIAEGGSHIVVEENLRGRNDEFPVLGPDAPVMAARLAELDANQIEIFKQKGYSNEVIADLKASQTGQQFNRESAATGGGIPTFRAPPRLLSQGAEELPWLWNHISWAQRQSNYWTRQLFRAQATLHLSEPELQSNPQLMKDLQQHVDNMLQPDPQLTQKVNRFTSTWFMGFAPASAMVNGMQTLTTLVPELTNITGRPLESYRRWTSAIAEVTKASSGKWVNKEIDVLMRNAEHAGEIDYSMWDETAQTHEQIATNFKRAMFKNKPQNVGQRLGTAGGAWSNAAMWMFKTVEKFNHRVTLVAAYKTYKDLGFTVEEATQKAFEVNRAVNYGGGRAGRPIGLYSGKDQFTRGAAMLATNMQNYNLGVISQLGRYLQQGFFRPEGLKPAEVYAARKAATQMLGTQLAAAGLLGLPFASGMLALLNQMFPNLELNKNLRETVAEFFDSDQANGSILSDAAMTGLPSMLGWDMQSRLSMGNITPGVSEYNGFQPQLLLGPPANLASNIVNGTLRMSQGEVAGAEAFIPPGVRKLTQYLTNDRTLKDYKNRPLFNPTLGETAGIALGFNPKRLSDFNVASRIAEQNRLVANRREGQFRAQLAEEVLKGNFGSVRQELLARQSSDKTYNMIDAVRRIAQVAEDLTFPRDLRREGTVRTSASRQRLLSAFNLDPSQPTEAARLQFRQQIEQRLGLPAQRDGSQVALAQVMDELRSRDPSASRSDLRRTAELMLRGSRRTPSLLPELQE